MYWWVSCKCCQPTIQHTGIDNRLWNYFNLYTPRCSAWDKWLISCNCFAYGFVLLLQTSLKGDQTYFQYCIVFTSIQLVFIPTVYTNTTQTICPLKVILVLLESWKGVHLIFFKGNFELWKILQARRQSFNLNICDIRITRPVVETCIIITIKDVCNLATNQGWCLDHHHHCNQTLYLMKQSLIGLVWKLKDCGMWW